MGIQVLPPKINESKYSFVAHPEKNEILFGFSAIKGIGDSAIDSIIASQPYSSFDDYLSKVQDKTATVALIKAGAFPTNNKMKLMQKYAKSLFKTGEYKPVSSLPTKAKLLTDWNIDTSQYMVGKKVDKEAVLCIYNAKRKEQFDAEQKAKYTKHMQSFKEQYAQDEYLWEFQSLSMFVTDNPLQEAYDRLGVEWDEIPDGEKAVVPCVITNVQRKKDKHNNQFAYIDLCTNTQIVEATIWSRQLKEYAELVSKGSCVCILGRKQEGHLFVERMKPYTQWLKDTEHLAKH